MAAGAGRAPTTHRTTKQDHLNAKTEQEGDPSGLGHKRDRVLLGKPEATNRSLAGDGSGPLRSRVVEGRVGRAVRGVISFCY